MRSCDFSLLAVLLAVIAAAYLNCQYFRAGKPSLHPLPLWSAHWAHRHTEVQGLPE